MLKKTWEDDQEEEEEVKVEAEEKAEADEEEEPGQYRRSGKPCVYSSTCTGYHRYPRT